ncbi:MAG: radical SAM protein [Thermoplasmatota archaeon]
MEIRVSSGTANELGLKKTKSLEKPTTAYLMIPGGKCRGGCTFCPQARGDSKWLSRVSWPKFEMKEVTEAIKGSDLARICIQSPDIEDYEEKVTEAVDILKKAGKPISLSTPPLSKEILKQVKGPVDHIGIGIDAATDSLRKENKRNYDPLIFWDYMGKAIEVFGRGKVVAHIIVGMGETLGNVAWSAYRAAEAGAKVSLFSYQSKEETPDIDYYREAQLVTHLVGSGTKPFEAIQSIVEGNDDVVKLVEEGEVFRTKGCPGCNRPYYTTRPGDEHRNFPRKPDREELLKIMLDLGLRDN